MSVSNNQQPHKTAIVIGATGLVGGFLVKQLLASGSYDTIYQIVRHAAKSTNNNQSAQGSLKNIVIPNFANLEQALAGLDLNGADAFSTLGTTLKQAGSKDAFKQVDYGYNLSFAQQVKKQGARHFLLLSATGADANSFIFYNKVKGQLEDAVKQAGFEQLSVFHPSLLIGQHGDKRMLEGIGQHVFNAAKSLLPPTWAFRPIEAERVAQAMCMIASQSLAKAAKPATKIYSNADLLNLTLENHS